MSNITTHDMEHAYHVTSLDNLSSILDEGLLKRYSSFWKGRGGCVYLYAQPPESVDVENVLLEIDVRDLEVSHPASWEYICWQDIDPARIKIMTSH